MWFLFFAIMFFGIVLPFATGTMLLAVGVNGYVEGHIAWAILIVSLGALMLKASIDNFVRIFGYASSPPENPEE